MVLELAAGNPFRLGRQRGARVQRSFSQLHLERVMRDRVRRGGELRAGLGVEAARLGQAPEVLQQPLLVRTAPEQDLAVLLDPEAGPLDIPRFGVARFRCKECGDSRFVPFSCKRRRACPSCDAKRAVVESGHALDDLPPDAEVGRGAVCIHPGDNVVAAQRLRAGLWDADRRR